MQKVKWIVNVITRERDLNGNCYSLAIIYSTATGRSLPVYDGWGGGGNVLHNLKEITGCCYSPSILEFKETIKRREFDRLKKRLNPINMAASHIKEAQPELVKEILNLEQGPL